VLSDYGGDPNELVPKPDAAGAKALELDPTLARPHAGIAFDKMAYKWDFAGGEAEFRKTIELDPSDATTHQWFAEALAQMGGRAREAIDEANRAHQLDPLSPIIEFAQAETYIADHQLDKAVELLNKSVAENPTFGRAHLGLALAYWGLRRYPETIAEFKTSGKLEGDETTGGVGAALESGFRSGGWPAALRKAIEFLQARRKTMNGVGFAFQIARLCGDLGDKDHTFEWLNLAYQEHDIMVIGLRTEVTLESLHSDPRYAELVRKIGFPK
jgi:tetratricopeptide (TPR) repeat protein